MQATVRSFDPATRSGTVLLDDGIQLPYDADAFATADMRHLRIGQRVRVDTTGSDADLRITGLTLYTLR